MMSQSSPLYDVVNFQVKEVSSSLPRGDVDYKAVMLTGANGFIGVHLLSELVSQTSAKIYALVRGKNQEEAENKLSNQLAHYGLDHCIFESRVEVVLGDIAKRRLGLSKKTWQDLSSSLDAIYHNGAYVHHLQSYDRMRDTNVVSVKDIIELATHHKLKRIHFISSKYSNFTAHSPYAFEGMPSISPPADFVSFGYTITKWAGEWLLWKAAQSGVQVDIYRLGQISGHSKTGVANYQKNNFTRFIIGCIQMGFAPESTEQNDLVPVDYTARAVIALSCMPYQSANGWHIVHPDQRSYAAFFEMTQVIGHPLSIIDVDDWYQHLRKVTEENSLYPLIDFHSRAHKAPYIHVKVEQTQHALKTLGVGPPPAYSEVLPLYFDYWHTVGLL